MKNVLFSVLALMLFSTLATAQPSGSIWVGSKSNNANANAVLAFWQSTNDAYTAGDDEKMWAAYTDDAAEISPDGSITYGKKALRENWAGFLKMLDAKPSFNYSNPMVRILGDNLAIVTWDSEADIKMGGQQIGGKTKGVAFLRKINNQWKIEFDVLTPVMQMPEAKH